MATLKAIILGSGRGVRHLDSTQSYPMALLQDRIGRRLLDWTLSALADAGVDEVVFVGGYHIEKVIRLYPKLRYYFDPRWQEGNDLQALACASSELDTRCVIVRSDVVFRLNVVNRLLETCTDIAIGTRTDASVDGALSTEDFAGMVALSTTATSRLREQIELLLRGPEAQPTTDLVGVLSSLDLPRRLLEVGDDWAYIETPRSLARFVFGSKAQTLERLRPLVTTATIMDQVRFTVAEWRGGSDAVLNRVGEFWADGLLVVRSSALVEDDWNGSQAGRFRSELGVSARDRDEIRRAVESVVSAFDEKGDGHGANEVFIQPLVDDVVLSGVLFSRHPETGAPYVIVNYDDTTRRTDTVTSGRGEDLRTTVVYKYADPSIVSNRHIAHSMRVASELEELSGHDSLDIEFAFDTAGRCYVFQVRVIAEGTERSGRTDSDFDQELTVLREYVDGLIAPHPHLYGEWTILANMPDWNPAEIIGVSPRPLAWSLFQHLITDRVWAEARAASGYRSTSPEPLVVLLSGHPYVDTRASLNSFVPAALAPRVGEKLVTHGLDWLREHPELHDKLEFEVAVTCLDFDFERHRQRLLGDGFTFSDTEEFRTTLRGLTDDIVCGRVATIDGQHALVGRLAERRQGAMQMKRDSPVSIIRAVALLLDDCARYGTLPFSVLARYAFVATAFLKSLQARGVMSRTEIDMLMRSIPTVASQISGDFAMLKTGALSTDEFLREYGHLRPGTYDITSRSYAEWPEFYLSNLDGVKSEARSADRLADAGALVDSKSSEIAELIAEAGFAFTVEELRDFILASIPARERSKFEFTKNVSAVLSLVAQFGQLHGLSRDDMSFVPIARLLDLATSSPSSVLEAELKRAVALNRKRYSLHRSIRLPHMITSITDLTCFEVLKWLPNFVTSRRVTATVVDVEEPAPDRDLAGKIALIESADPGYDWIFARGISGLVTKYGGAASHMAIRAAELGLPAAIGCGDVIYDPVASARTIELDCAEQRIRILA